MRSVSYAGSVIWATPRSTTIRCVAGGDAPFRPEVGKLFSRGGIPAGLPSLTVGSPEVSLRCSTIRCVAGGDAPFRPEVGKQREARMASVACS